MDQEGLERQGNVFVVSVRFPRRARTTLHAVAKTQEKKTLSDWVRGIALARSKRVLAGETVASLDFTERAQLPDQITVRFSQEEYYAVKTAARKEGAVHTVWLRALIRLELARAKT